MKEELPERLSFRYDSLKLIGVTKDELCFQIRDEFGILILKKDFLRFQKNIFDDRQRYFERLGYFAGIDFSGVMEEDFELIEDFYINHYGNFIGDTDDIEITQLPVYRVQKIYTDAEHG